MKRLSREDLRQRDLEKARAVEKNVRRIVEHECAVSLMNNTKWRVLVEALHGLPVGYRAKFLDTDGMVELGPLWSPTPAYFDSSRVGPFRMLDIEWLDILASSHQDEVETRLLKAAIPFHREGDSIRVIGHVRYTPGP